ncbi:MAG: helix-turn-helix domain-containing protein [Lachnospiraceae bacterium]|nr:helix-turn-helix domain-containing protein [Lachnospiraceae bacterium]
MISIQTIKNSIDDLKAITKTEFAIYDTLGALQTATGDIEKPDNSILSNFADSAADSQVVGVHHLLKVMDGEEPMYILDAVGNGEDTYTYARIAVSSLQNLMAAYKEKFDRGGFFQNLIMDNLLLVDIYNRAKKLHIESNVRRVAMLVETSPDKNSVGQELLSSMFSVQNGDYTTAIDENGIVLIKKLDEGQDYDDIRGFAKTIVDMMQMEAMMNVRVAYGTIVDELKDVSKSYKEAMMALEVGRIFYTESRVAAYNNLGIGRLIYQLPENLCHMYVEEIFGDNIPDDLDEETINTINKFFENNLNISETSRQLFVHRNTLVYRIEKLQKQTGLDIRLFDDALTLKIALMVVDYMKHQEQIRRNS